MHSASENFRVESKKSDCSPLRVKLLLPLKYWQANPEANVILVTHETTTPAFYKGKDKHRLVTNVLFR